MIARSLVRDPWWPNSFMHFSLIRIILNRCNGCGTSYGVKNAQNRQVWWSQGRWFEILGDQNIFMRFSLIRIIFNGVTAVVHPMEWKMHRIGRHHDRKVAGSRSLVNKAVLCTFHSFGLFLTGEAAVVHPMGWKMHRTGRYHDRKVAGSRSLVTKQFYALFTHSDYSEPM